MLAMFFAGESTRWPERTHQFISLNNKTTLPSSAALLTGELTTPINGLPLRGKIKRQFSRIEAAIR
jgi:SET domain-containing protein